MLNSAASTYLGRSLFKMSSGEGSNGHPAVLQLQYRSLAEPEGAPEDMLRPEGRTLWKLTDAVLAAPHSVRLEEMRGLVLSFSTRQPAARCSPITGQEMFGN